MHAKERQEVNSYMQPVIFDGCVGWLHFCDNPTKRHGVVICNPLGHEATWTYRAIRKLAENFANADMVALRFDYPGTGDSIGSADVYSDLESWIRSIRQAADYLKYAHGISVVSLCGIRYGATLALAAAKAIPDLGGIAMLAPIVSGKAYVRELIYLQKMWRDLTGGVTSSTDAKGPILDVLGHRYSRDIVDHFRQPLLMEANCSVPRRIFLLASKGHDTDKLASYYETLGSDVEQKPFVGYESFLLDTLEAKVPLESFRRVVDWLGQRKADHDVPESRRVPLRWDDVIDLPSAIERPVVFDQGRLFGILCEPANGQRSGITVLIPSTGGSVRSGDARFATLLARRIVTAGHASFRFDVNGVGDSIDVPASELAIGETRIICSEQSIADTVNAARWLSSIGHTQIASVGVCSGAYLALQAALREQSICGLVLFNLQRFLWPKDASVSDVLSEHAESTRHYARSLRNRAMWKKLLRGEISLRSTMRPLYRYATQIARQSAINIRKKQIQSFVMSLEKRNVHTDLIYGANDTGIDDLEKNFGLLGKKLKSSKSVHVSISQNIDHALYSHIARKNAIAFVVSALQQMSKTTSSGHKFKKIEFSNC